MKRYPLNIIKMYKWSHLIKKTKIEWEWNNLTKRKKKSNAQLQAN
jgi:hypothetical protein